MHMVWVVLVKTEQTETGNDKPGPLDFQDRREVAKLSLSERG